MKSLLASVRHDGELDRVDRAVRTLEEEWRHGEPNLEAHWAALGPDATVSVLAAMIKVDLRCRFNRGDRPEINDYLDRFPGLCDHGERMLSLIYEEYCLREEQGDQPDPESFCRRYEPWRDSLASQLKYHQLLSRVVGASVAPRFPEPGDHFQEFAIDSVLGQGGAARVYRARNDLLGGREVAIKVSSDRGQEPSIMGRLDHEHIVPVHNVVFQPETRLRGLIMPYRPGLPLDEVIRRVNPASRPRKARVLWQVVSAPATRTADTPAATSQPGWSAFPIRGTYAEGVAWIIATLARAVAYAHARGIQHRDIKPANVLLTQQNGPQLLDFNLAHDPHAAEHAEAALRGGTLPYMAPEQLDAFLDPARWDDIDAAADQYALGLLMHELLTGKAPDVPDQSLPLPRAIRSMLDRRFDFGVTTRQVNPAIPSALGAITERCLAFDSGDRYPDVQTLADELQRFLGHQPLLHTFNPSVRERFANWCRRNVIPLAATAAVAVFLSAVAIKQLSPVEQRGSFRAAVSALEHDNGTANDPHEAIRLLDPLTAEFPNSPLPRFYLAAAETQAGNIRQAATHYAAVLRIPDAEADLLAWGRGRPHVVEHLEDLGIGLHAGYPDHARKALAMAVRLGSTSDDVFKTAAYLDDTDHHFESAEVMWTASIRATEARKPIDRDHLIDRYRCRARTRIGWAGDLHQKDDPMARDEARGHYLDALDDLEHGDGLIIPTNQLQQCIYDFLRAEAELGLCDLEIGLHHHAEADEHCRRASVVIDQIAQRIGRDRDLRRLEVSFQRLPRMLVDLRHRVESMLNESPVATR